MDLPTPLSETWYSDHHFALELSLDPEMDYFRGHFEGAPVLAGVIQLGWVMEFAQLKFARPCQFRGLQSAKFQRLILPPVTLQLDIEYLAPRHMLKFKYLDSAGPYSSGGVSLEPASE